MRTWSPQARLSKKGALLTSYDTAPSRKFSNNEEEYVVQQMTSQEEAVARRKAYDMHLKADILHTGRNTTMNKTYDQYYHDPYYVDPAGLPF